MIVSLYYDVIICFYYCIMYVYMTRVLHSGMLLERLQPSVVEGLAWLKTHESGIQHCSGGV